MRKWITCHFEYLRDFSASGFLGTVGLLGHLTTSLSRQGVKVADLHVNVVFLFISLLCRKEEIHSFLRSRLCILVPSKRGKLFSHYCFSVNLQQKTYYFIGLFSLHFCRVEPIFLVAKCWNKSSDTCFRGCWEMHLKALAQLTMRSVLSSFHNVFSVAIT